MTRQIRLSSILATMVVILAGSVGSAVAGAVPTNVEINGSSHDLKDVVLHETVALDGSVTGVVTNRSDSTVQDVKVLIQHSWRWRNEYRPGDKDPGRAEYIRLEKPLPPGETVTFRYHPIPALPNRSDGHFETTAEIVAFDQITFNTIQ